MELALPEARYYGELCRDRRLRPQNGLRNDDFTLVRVIHHDSWVEAKER